MHTKLTFPGTGPSCLEMKTAGVGSLAGSLVFPPVLGVHRQAPWDPSRGDQICIEPAASSGLYPSALCCGDTAFHTRWGAGQGLVQAKECGYFVLGFPDPARPLSHLAFSYPLVWGPLHPHSPSASSPRDHGERPVETGPSFRRGAAASPAGEGQAEGPLLRGTRGAAVLFRAPRSAWVSSRLRGVGAS